HDREDERNNGREREHYARIAGAKMRNGRKHQEIGNCIGNRCGDQEVAQPAYSQGYAPAAQQEHDQKHAACAQGNNEGPDYPRYTGLGSHLAERQAEAEQRAGDDQQRECRIPDKLRACTAGAPQIRRESAPGGILRATQLRSSGSMGIGMKSTPSSISPLTSSDVASP